MIARIEAGKPELRPRGAQIISHIFGIGQKLRRQHRANRVAARVFCTGVTMPRSKEPCHRIGGAALQFLAQDIHGWFYLHQLIPLSNQSSARENRRSQGSA